ncbi:MAG TPA: hypothetical protein VNW04_04240 [Puia sp.]|jgi:hypothetical protein|nr:hypothetical protein [Puia sp.]
MKARPVVLCILLFVIVVASCKKTNHYPATSLTDYFLTLQVGKYAIYRLDSLNFYYYGQLDTVTSYLAKDSVESSFVDGSGNTAWNVTRYLSDTTGTNWNPTETYTVTPFQQRIELTEDNLRFVKLAFPLSTGFSWQGNDYLPYAPYQDFFDFSDDSHLTLGNWNYTYQSVNKPYAVGSQNFDSTVTVLQENDSINVPIRDVNSFASRTYWSETYAKHIGLVYRHTEMWEYQPPTPDGTQTGYKIGFQLTMQLVSHN